MDEILIIPEYFDKFYVTPCGYIRMVLPLVKCLTAKEFNFRIGRPEDIFSFNGDLVITQRFALDSLDLVQVRDILKNKKIRMIYDLDDNLLELNSEHPEFEVINAKKKNVKYLVNNADIVWCSTESLSSSVREMGALTNLVENELDTSISLLEDSFNPRSASIKFLYFGTSSHQQEFDRIVLPAWHAAIRKYPDIELDVIGIKVNDFTKGINSIGIGSEFGRCYPLFMAALKAKGPYDFGLAPLLDTTFNQSKSSIKWQEYTALGAASILCDVMAYEFPIKKNMALGMKSNWQSCYAQIEFAIENASILKEFHSKSRNYLREVQSRQYANQKRLNDIEGLINVK